MKTKQHTPQIILFLCLTLTTSLSVATIFYSKNEALELAFGKEAKVEMLSLFPDQAQTTEIQKLAKAPLESGLFSFYVGKMNGKLLGYAAIETSTVRTQPETLMIVLAPDGNLRNVFTLAFHEPPEYLPPERWYNLLANRALAQMGFNEGVQGITGATLSTHSAINSIRKVMAIYQVLVKPTVKP